MINTKTIGAIIIALIILFGTYAYCIQDKDKSIITVNGNVIDTGLSSADVWASVMGGGSQITVSPGEKFYTIIEMTNGDAVSKWYKVWLIDENGIVWESSDLYLAPDETKKWSVRYTSPMSEGKYDILIESGKIEPGKWDFTYDDMASIEIIVEKEAPPDPCEDVVCNNKCDPDNEPYYLYNGYCVESECIYTSDLVDGKCGFVEDPCKDFPCTATCDNPYSLSDGICKVVNDKATCTYTRELIEGKCGYTSPCENYVCDDDCEGQYSLSDGICKVVNDKATCDYIKQLIDGKCGYTAPVDDPCENYVCDDDCEGQYSLLNGKCVEVNGNPTCEYTKELIDGQCNYNVDTCDSFCDDVYYHYDGTWDGINCVYIVDKVHGQCNYTKECTDDPDCENHCASPYTWLHDGTCIDGKCEYIEDANSLDCGYVAPASGGGGGGSSSITRPTATPVPADDTAPLPDEASDIPYTTIAIVLFVLAIGGYLYANREIFK